MLCFRSPVCVKITLFFFSTMLLYQPALASDFLLDRVPVHTQFTSKILPVSYVDDIQFQRLSREYQRMGYRVKQGSFDQLRRIQLASNGEPVASPEQVPGDTDIATADLKAESKTESTAESTSTEKNTDCKKPGKSKQPETNNKKEGDEKAGNEKGGKSEANGKPALNAGTDKPADNNKQLQTIPGCDEENTAKDNAVKDNSNQQNESTTSTEPMAVEFPQPVPPATPAPEPVPAPTPSVVVQPSIDVDVNVFKGGGGGHSDSARVFFIVTGIFVVAAFVVYVGKYIGDIVQGGKHDLWWEVIFNNTFLDTNARQHGRFNGVKIITGFNSSDVIQVAMMGELGSADLNLVFDDETSPLLLNFTTNYWMLGATARLLLSYNRLNSNYLYMDFLGGKTVRSETDTIGAARMGFSFGINDHVRLGVSYGAQYIGLNSNQGFVHNSGQYWHTFGVEFGWRF